MPPILYRRLRPVLALVLGLWGACFVLSAASAQPGMGPAAVGFTEARRHDIHQTLRLTGSVEARTSSVVASEVAGLVVELVAREGDAVSRGGPLVRLRRENLELRLAARRADLKEAEARLVQAKRNQVRFRELFDEDIVSRERLDDAESEVIALEGRVESLQAEIDLVEDDLERSVVRAPYAGVVVEEHAQVGEWIATGGPVVELLDLEHLEVELQVPERRYPDLQPGASVQVSFEALPGHGLTGKLGAVIPRADSQSRTFPVKVRFDNRDHEVGVGMLAQVELPVGGSDSALIVPKDALVRRGSRTVVYRIDGQGKSEEIDVETGSGSGEWIQIAGPVSPGDRIVTRGNERIRPGQDVEGSPVTYELP